MEFTVKHIERHRIDASGYNCLLLARFTIVKKLSEEKGRQTMMGLTQKHTIDNAVIPQHVVSP